MIRTEVRGICSSVFNSLGMAIPPTIRQLHTEKCSAKDFCDTHIVLSIKEMQFTSVAEELKKTPDLLPPQLIS